MPPKKKVANEASKKTEQKKKEKIIEDKTFGLKNKKGKKQQTFVKQVTQQVKYGGNPSTRKLAQEQDNKKKTQEQKKKEQDELKELFKPVVSQKVSAGADPKSVVCAFFKQGLCSKGDKCKFSHDISLERKGEKRSIYVDSRDVEDTMDKWDQNKLEEVIAKKHGEKGKPVGKTDIVCKFFLEALEKNLYGWFWNCPNGAKCIYRHALPPGFVLKKKQEKESKEEISIEEFIETERSKLGENLTKLTLETFLEWKKRKLKEKTDKFEAEQAKKKAEFKSGKVIGRVSGREVFMFKPELAEDDAEDDEATEDMSVYRHNDDDVDDDNDEDEKGITKAKEITLEQMSFAASEADGTGTVDKSSSAAERLKHNEATSTTSPQDRQAPDTTEVDENGLDEACGGSDVPLEDGAGLVNGIPIEESLFQEDDIDDLELDDLEIVD
ncbi:zinc finger CCCH domain-containing protein 15-like [Montipora capricornis]|uniref:zinc finger CCCH domain-containing protein 15-like n=1 Tax=Montipora capricornis TaxID=246305 RepID=UPI0035F203DA